MDNFRERVNENVADTLKEQIGELLTPLFAQQAVVLPHGRIPWNSVEYFVANDPENLGLLTTIFQSTIQGNLSSLY